MLLLTFLALLIAQSHATTLKVWTWTVWDFGGHVENGFEKIVQIIQQSGADVFALQQANGKPLTDFQAALGPDWNLAHNGNTIIIAKHIISGCKPYQTPLNPYAGIGCTINGEKDGKSFQISFWSIHYVYLMLGPSEMCLLYSAPIFQYSPKFSFAEQLRKQEILDLIKNHPRFHFDYTQADEIPMIVAGDFSTGSHLDWTKEAASIHCGKYVEWPVTKVIENAGFVDAFRSLHSDVVANPGFTYSPAKTAPNDRVDFIFYKGEKVQPVSSEAHGQETGPNNKAPNQWNNAWPSDHYAVSAEFEIKA